MPDAVQIVCSQCLAVNRLPGQRLAESPVCGRCKTSLTPGHPIELSDRNFHQFARKTSLPILVIFGQLGAGRVR